MSDLFGNKGASNQPIESSRSGASLKITDGFWAGCAFASPFYAEFLPWSWSGLLAVPFFLILVLKRVKPSRPPWAIAPFALLLVLHGLALLASDSPFQNQVTKELIIATWLFTIYLFTSEDSIDGFFSALIPLATLVAILGLTKAALLDRGYLIGRLLDSCYYYPAGSALCVNYNNLGMLWLIAIVGCLKKKWWILIPILVAAGALSSSRRFLVLAPFAFILAAYLYKRAALPKLVAISMLSATLVFAVSDPKSFELYRFGHVPFKVILETPGNERQTDTDTASIKVNRSQPSAMLSTLADGTLGTASRLDFWSLGFKLAKWTPSWWNYHHEFSCRFSGCRDHHYPHLSIISEWIIGGALFGVIAMLYYLLPAAAVWRNGGPWALSMLAFTTPYSTISGDTVFSLPGCIACLLVALTTLRKSPPINH